MECIVKKVDKMSQHRILRFVTTMTLAVFVALTVVACSGDTETIVQTVVVEKEVIVQGADVVQTVVVEKEVQVQVKGDKVIETVIVEKEVQVKGEKEIIIQTVVSSPPTPVPATAIPLPTAIAINIPEPKNAAGSLVMAIDAVGSGGGVQSAGAGTEGAMHKGITETFFMVTDDSAETGVLAETWTVAEDLSSVTINLRQGVQFHGGYGEMTSADVIWNMNDANSGTTPTSIHGQAGDMNALFGANPWEAIDDYTVKATFSAFNPTWTTRELNLGGESVAIVSKKAYDDNGEDWALQSSNMIATGPFEIVEWAADDRIVTKAVSGHWRQAPAVSEITWLEVPEADTKMAMLRTGEIDMGEVPLSRVGELSAQGFEVLAAGGRADEIGIMFAGNLWETNHITTGEELDRQPLNQAKKLAWLGHPDDEADMEQAKKVRTALSMALDRELINEQLNAGLGWPTYITMFSPTAPQWQDKWNIDYDPAGAESLLDDAGLERKDNDVRFEIVIYGQPSPSAYADMALAIGGMWDDIGVLTSVQNYAYNIIRPSLVQRTQVAPFLKTCGESTSSAPWDWPRGIKMSSMSRGGFSCAQESPEIAGWLVEAQNEPDAAKRIEINNKMAQWMHDWAFAPGVVAVPRTITVNPKSIQSWDMPTAFQASYRGPEYIVPAR
ncbi:MAG: ABC transporter substrate-binding protein [SAR202 cluster bacterium]|nr:ABC transporter substrate-binding protein [SAR202 cluster bacterium]